MFIRIRHATTYRYAAPVSFGPHRLMLRPRDSFDLRVVDTTTGEVSYARTIEGHTGDRAVTVDLMKPDAGFAAIENEADAKAVRGAVLEIIDYLECEMVRRDACVAAFETKEAGRRDTTRKSFRADEKGKP